MEEEAAKRYSAFWDDQLSRSAVRQGEFARVQQKTRRKEDLASEPVQGNRESDSREEKRGQGQYQVPETAGQVLRPFVLRRDRRDRRELPRAFQLHQNDTRDFQVLQLIENANDFVPENLQPNYHKMQAPDSLTNFSRKSLDDRHFGTAVVFWQMLVDLREVQIRVSGDKAKGFRVAQEQTLGFRRQNYFLQSGLVHQETP